MAVDLPPPKVPELQQPGNFVDLEQLGSAPLLTYVWYPDIAEGQYFVVNWRGCGAQGEVVDVFDTIVDVVAPDDDGMPVLIQNQKLMSLDQGWVFYSYYVPDSVQPDKQNESLRLFFNVGKRSTTSLAVPQCKESHDLKLDVTANSIPNEFLFVTPPYKAMRAGDKVTLTLDLYFAEDSFFTSLIRPHTVTDAEAGQPLVWKIPSTELEAIGGGYALMSQKIDYAEPTFTTQGPVQTLNIVPAAVPLLPRLEIVGVEGDSLDPQAFPDGITLKVEPYAGLRIDDEVVVYISSESRLVKTLRTDVSTLDSQVLELTVEQDWLLSHNGKKVDFMYQYARLAAAGSSVLRTVTLRQPLFLPAPEIAQATLDDESETGVSGHAFALALVGGVQVRTPQEAVIGPDDQVRMHWDGYGSTGSFIAEPSEADRQLFLIPASAVPANMGKRLNVYYEVIDQEGLSRSKVFDLEVRGIDSGWPTLQNVQPFTVDGWLTLAQVPTEGAGLELGSWTYMAEGQRVRIIVCGLSTEGVPQCVDVRTGDAESVTAAECMAGKVSALIPKGFLEGLLQDAETNKVTVEVSFDEGATYVQFPFITFRLRDQV